MCTEGDLAGRVYIGSPGGSECTAFWTPSHEHAAVTILTATALVARDTDAAEASVQSGVVGNVGQCSCCFVG